MTTNLTNSTNKVPNVPPLRFPEFTGEWEKSTLGGIADIVGGGTPETDRKEYWNGEIIWYTPSEIGKNKYSSDSERHITQEGLDNSSAKLLPSGTILLSTRATIGESSIALNKCTTNQGFQSLIAQRGIYHEFLYYLIATKKHELVRRACGSTFLEISANEVRKVPVLVPSFKEQYKLSTFLGLIDQRIETQNKIIEDLRLLILGVNKRLFYNYNSTEYVQLGEIATITNGANDVQDANLEYTDGLYPFYDRSETIKFLDTYFLDKEAIIYPGEGSEFFPRYHNGKFALHQRCYAIYDVREEYVVKYLYYYMQNLNNYFIRNAVGSTVSSLRLDTFKRVRIPILSKIEQTKICNVLDSLSNKLQIEQNCLSKYQSQKQYLLQQMFI